MDFIIWIAIITVLFVLYNFLSRDMGYWESLGVPCDNVHPVIYTIRDLVKLPHETDMENFKKYGKIFGSYSPRGRRLFISDPEIIKFILVKDFNFFVNRVALKSGFKMLDVGLVFAGGNDWKRIRSVITPTFSSNKIKKMSLVMKDCSKNLTMEMIKQCEKEDEINIQTFFRKFSSEVLGVCAFGIRFDPFKNPKHPFITNSKKLWSSELWKLSMFSFSCMIPNMFSRIKLKITDGLGLPYFKNAAEEIIQKRNSEPGTQKGIDFLRLMLDAKEGKLDKSEENQQDANKDDTSGGFKTLSTKTMDNEEIIAQCTTFLIAGSETVSSALSNTIWNLACHQDIQEKLLIEIDEAWESHGEINYDVINAMPYLNAVVSESLRLKTISIRLVRECNREYTIPNTNIVIPKGAIIYIPIHVIHHNPEFFPDPQTFNPDRFLPENRDKIRSFTYMPFGDGPRQCLAMRFSLIQVKLCLAYLLRYVKFLATEKTKKPQKSFVALGVLHNKFMVRPEKRRDFDK